MTERKVEHGTLLWYDVEPNAARQWTAAAVVLCAACGEIFVSGQPLDDTHAVCDLLRVTW